MNNLDQIVEACETVPHLGAESEGGVIDPLTFETHHQIGGEQPTQAVKLWLEENLNGRAATELNGYITPDVPETITEVNPPPLRSPRSTAAAQRLFSILVDSVHQIIGPENGQNIQLIHGAALRPPNITPEDASRHVDLFKQLYYQFQIQNHGDKVGAAMGDHYNMSAPWKKHRTPEEESGFYIQIAGRMRLMAAALTMGLATASPLYYASQNGGTGTVLTGSNSNRLSQVWPGRTIMDIPGLFSGRQQFLSEMNQYLEDRLLFTGRDVWLPVRPQAAPLHPAKSFQETCADCGLDIENNLNHRATALGILVSSFTGKDESSPLYRPLRKWRVDMVEEFIRAPRNRVEMRVAETPPAFENQTPYEYIKAIHTFLELYFIYLSNNPERIQQLTYNGRELQAAKHNEYTVLTQGLDGKMYWPDNRKETTGREMLADILNDEEFKILVRLLNRGEDLEIINQVALGKTKPPAERMRQEIGQEYGIDARQSGIDRFLQDNHGGDPDRYPKELLARTRTAMTTEIKQIKSDIPTVPSGDQEFLKTLLNQVEIVRSKIPSTSTAAA